tara:strand:+ start:141 stop:458 length:318 start_codon:yes stop_codon:yes gene_type:complete
MTYKMKGFSGFGYLIEQAAKMGGKQAKKISEDIKGGMLIEDTTEKMFSDARQRKIQNANKQSPKPKPPKRVTEVIEVGPVTSPGVVDGKLLEKQKRKNKNKNKKN